MLDDLVEGAVGGVFEAADAASEMSSSQTRRGAIYGCLLNLLGLIGLVACVVTLALAFVNASYWWLVASGASLLLAIFGFGYSFYLRQIKPSLEGLQ